MLYIKFNGGLICQISKEYPKAGPWGKENGWLSVRDAESYEEACTWAKGLHILAYVVVCQLVP